MKSLLVFIPQSLNIKKSGYIYGKIVYDAQSDVKKFYIIDVYDEDCDQVDKSVISFIGYYSTAENCHVHTDRRNADWIRIAKSKKDEITEVEYYEYTIQDVTINDKPIVSTVYQIIIIIYDQLALQKTELFVSRAISGDHFYELMTMLQNNRIKSIMNKRNYLVHLLETCLIYHVLLYFYIISIITKVMKYLRPVLKYSSLGLHINNWLENMKWLLITVIQTKKFTLKTANHICAVLVDIVLGILVLRLLLYAIGDTPPSELLLSNAEKVVEFLKDLINWLMGAPAGLKLNYALNTMLGKFFLYHIDLWWTFLTFMKPVMDFIFDVLLLFGKLGLTFQISIGADLLALISFHTYCIYVYAARLFNTQLRGLTALFRLFLGKKKNPLRERIDSCQYQSDQLFVGTLLFTILLFLMPTTWVYYTVFTTLRLMLIGSSNFLTRLKFYLQVLPIYTFVNWLFRSYSIHSTVNISLYSCNKKAITVIMSMVVSSWKHTWQNCIPDTVICHPPIEWGVILKNIIWGQLLYPL